jgi:hypothetical protein
MRRVGLIEVVNAFRAIPRGAFIFYLLAAWQADKIHFIKEEA